LISLNTVILKMQCINNSINLTNGFLRTKKPVDYYDRIPLFYHVPKNAGTYFISIMILYLRLFRRERTSWLESSHETIKNIEIFCNKKSIGRIIAADPHNEVKKFFKTKDVAQVYFPVELKKIPKDFFRKIFIFGIIIEPDGFLEDNKIIELFNYYKFRFVKSLILRNPYERARSFYNYIVDDMSKHEWTHGLITGNNFEEYLESGYVEDSWVIRNICGIGDSVPIEEYHLDKANSILMSFNCVDISKTNTLLDMTFEQCYGYRFREIPREWSVNITRNSSSKKDMIDFSDLKEETQKKFLDRTKYDLDLYKTNVIF